MQISANNEVKIGVVLIFDDSTQTIVSPNCRPT